MKSINEKPDSNQANNQTTGKSTSAAAKRGAGSNEINNGSVGLEGSPYNGASELRQLRAKRGR
jgi:hypothetical protein